MYEISCCDTVSDTNTLIFSCYLLGKTQKQKSFVLKIFKFRAVTFFCLSHWAGQF